MEDYDHKDCIICGEQVVGRVPSDVIAKVYF